MELHMDALKFLIDFAKKSIQEEDVGLPFSSIKTIILTTNNDLHNWSKLIEFYKIPHTNNYSGKGILRMYVIHLMHDPFGLRYTADWLTGLTDDQLIKVVDIFLAGDYEIDDDNDDELTKRAKKHLYVIKYYGELALVIKNIKNN
jgi:hypothetical protein